jgi:hypothetical protein
VRKRSQFDRLVKRTAIEANGSRPAGTSDVPAVQRSGPATLRPPSLLQQPDPAAQYRLGGEYQLRPDPELLASMRQMVEQQLDPARVVPALTQVNLAAPSPTPNATANAAGTGASAAPAAPVPATAAPAAGAATPAQGPAAPNPFSGPPTPAPAAAVPAGKGPDTPRAASVGDLTRAVMAVPAIDQAIARLRLQASEQVERDWGRLSTGERVGVVSSLAVIGMGALGGIASDPEARATALGLLNGRPLPVPGLNWMRVEVNSVGDNVMVGLHVDVGSLLPPSLGFGPGSPQPIGAPPVPGQRSVAENATSDETRPEPGLASRITEASGGGTPLGLPVQARLESALDADLSGVRVHTDARADALARSVDATAFTTGRAIFFREGAYAPGSTEGLRLLAHEATHTVQQATGPVDGTLTVGGVALSTPGDPFERAAERTADRAVTHGMVPNGHGALTDDIEAPRSAEANTTVERPTRRREHDFSHVRVEAGDRPAGHGGTLRASEPRAQTAPGAGAVPAQRKPATARTPTGHVGGEPGSVTFLPGPGQSTLAPGEAGYSRHMLAETADASAAKLGDYAEMRLTNVVPNLTAVDKQIATRAAEKVTMLDDDHADNFFNLGYMTDMYQEASGWCQKHADELAIDKASQSEKFAAFNAWVPRANGFYTSVTRLDAMQDMLGVNDPSTMATALTSGLQEAQTVGERAQLAHDAGKAETLDIPVVDDTLADMSAQTTQAAREMNTAYLRFQQNLFSDEIAAIDSEGAADRTRMQEIQAVKAFVRNVGKTVDLSMAVVSGAPSVIANATQTVQRAGATVNAMRNRRAILKGQAPRHNPTYVTVNDKGDMIVRNVQTGMDRPIEGGEQTESPAGGGISLPASVSDILGSIADFAYSDEVEAINRRLETIKSRCDAVKAAAAFTETKERAQNFQDKLNAFALKCTALQRRMAQRRQAYLEFGVQLDNFARRDRASRAAGQAPKGGEERFATILTVVSQIREVLAIGEGAVGGFDSPDAIERWGWGLNERRTKSPPNNELEYLKLPDSEWKPIEKMWGQVKTFKFNVGQLSKLFGPVENQAKTLIGALHQGAGGSHGEY